MPWQPSAVWFRCQKTCALHRDIVASAALLRELFSNRVPRSQGAMQTAALHFGEGTGTELGAVYRDLFS